MISRTRTHANLVALFLVFSSMVRTTMAHELASRPEMVDRVDDHLRIHDVYPVPRELSGHDDAMVGLAITALAPASK